jgi:hypothetical protein
MDDIQPNWEIKKPIKMEPWDFESELRLIIVNAVPIRLILEKLDISYSRRKFTSLGLENPDLDQKRIENILERWSKNLQIDPPHLILGDGSWLIEDGIHRINCAIHLGATSIPVIFNRIEFPLWKKNLRK